MTETTRPERPFAMVPQATVGASLEPAWDDLLLLAARLTNAPIAWISLLDDAQERVQAALGLSPIEFSAAPSLGSAAIDADTTGLCAETSREDRFASHPWITGGPKLRSFAIQPVHDEHGATAGYLGVGNPALGESAAQLCELLPMVARQAEALLALSHARLQHDALISHVVHDLMSPIAALRLNTEYCVRETARTSPLWEAVQDIAQISEVVDRLVRDAGDVSREGRSIRLRSEEVDAEEVLQTFHERVFARMERAAVRLELRVDPDVGRVKLDERLLDRVLSNLLDFALARSTPGQTVTLVLRSVGEELELLMTDMGPTLDSSHLQQLFLPALGHGDAATHASGRRFGLAFCRLAVEAQHGTLRASNLASKGVLISFRLPLQRSIEVMRLSPMQPSRAPSRAA